jgi:hypothetical protein
MEAFMTSRCLLGVVAALAATLILSSLAAPAHADDMIPINPGFVPATMPTPDEARAALMTPVSTQPSTGDPATATTGVAAQQASPNAGAAGATNEPPPSGPIGSIGQTLPAKFSKRNDILDRVPILAIPLPLTDDQRKQIYDAVMADNSQPPAGAEALKPTSELSPDQALNGMHPLPASVRGIDGVTRLYYVKAQGKVLLVEPDVRTVVGEITPGR